MKTINKYVDEISGREFAKIEDAIASEKKNGGIKKLFGFWKEVPKDKNCCFANGGWWYQRTEAEYLMYIEALIKAIKEYEPWIASQYESDGGLQKGHIGSGYLIGRYLNDNNSELYRQYNIMSDVCPKCFRQWGQPYHANHCDCSVEPKEF